MKKNLLYLFTVLCMLSFFTACSDDEDVNVLEGVNTSFKGETLDLKYMAVRFWERKSFSTRKTDKRLLSP